MRGMKWLVVGMLALGSVACKKTEIATDEAAEESSEAAGEEAAGDEAAGEEAAPMAEAAGDTAVPQPERPENLKAAGERLDGGHDPAVPVSVEEFRPKLVESLCLAYDSCGNMELKSAVAGTFFMAGMSMASQSPEALEKFRALMGRIEEANLPMPRREDCVELFEIVTEETGVDGESLAASVEAGRVAYDAEQAGKCMGQLGTQSEVCGEYRPMGEEPDMQRLQAMMMQAGPVMEAHYKPCQTMFEGKVATGDSCSFDYECADQRTTCMGEEGKKTCQEVAMMPPGGMPGGGMPGGPAPGGPAPGGPAPGGSAPSAP
ncbi:hypothetical protein FRC98_17925 [Lujinxingia vulgaris]|uniref:Lipoprotein n=1 Tax=Lujinxingia vulgaris TaxID=2600176 RepID=A0A5C6X5U0_9DELT|nr:hypothetical protein [Lujinxingia vulgaris]TXD34997.1 hypothetical protein FRC98_17925 [Lujinxingia vulgaris]